MNTVRRDWADGKSLKLVLRYEVVEQRKTRDLPVW